MAMCSLASLDPTLTYSRNQTLEKGTRNYLEGSGSETISDPGCRPRKPHPSQSGGRTCAVRYRTSQPGFQSCSRPLFFTRSVIAASRLTIDNLPQTLNSLKGWSSVPGVPKPHPHPGSAAYGKVPWLDLLRARLLQVVVNKTSLSSLRACPWRVK